jgi:hypothetical protein
MQLRLLKALLIVGGGLLLIVFVSVAVVTLATAPALAVTRQSVRTSVTTPATTPAPRLLAATPTSTPTLLATGQPTPTPTLPPPQIAGCDIFLADNIWNTPIDKAPVDANSAAYVNTIGAERTLHPDFGAGLWEGGPIGIPYLVVPGNQAKVAVSFAYDDESDPGPYPVPTNAPIEGGPASEGDRHVLLLDRDNCQLYELYYTFPQEDGSWTAGSGAIFDLKSHHLRPATWTSADAAGLPILPGLVRYDEVASGEIRHAIRFTAPETRQAYIWPARHQASSLTEAKYPPMGQRFRLRADFDLTAYSPATQVILRAMQKYGIILADNGSSWYISGAPDERWDNEILHELKQIHGRNFEAVDVTALMLHQDSGQVRPAVNVPQNNFVYLPLAERP